MYILRHTSEDIERVLRDLGIIEVDPSYLQLSQEDITGDFLYYWDDIYFKSSKYLKLNWISITDCGDDEEMFIKRIIKSKGVILIRKINDDLIETLEEIGYKKYCKGINGNYLYTCNGRDFEEIESNAEELKNQNIIIDCGEDELKFVRLCCYYYDERL